MLAGAILYRLDAFLVAYEHDSAWHYFPSAPEILVTLGVIADRSSGLRRLRQEIPHSARPPCLAKPLMAPSTKEI